MDELSQLEYNLDAALKERQRLEERIAAWQAQIFELQKARYPVIWTVEIEKKLGFPANCVVFSTYAICSSMESATALSKSCSHPTRITVSPLTARVQAFDRVLSE
jgi:hypothetical protein